MSGEQVVTCPAMLIAAPASGQGKTTVTAAIAHWHRAQGRRVRVFKSGPDFLDPMVLEWASGVEVRQLDLWMGGAEHCAALLATAAQQADLILVEGVMGLHDGTPSCADLALHFDLPVLAVIDAQAMAQTFGAVVHGLATYRPGLRLAGALANRVGSPGHARMLRDSLPPGIAWHGFLARGLDYTMPSRHLGLVQAAEVRDLGKRIAAAADALSAHGPLPMPPATCFRAPSVSTPRAPGRELDGLGIAVARDAAFSFLYRANLDTLVELGARLEFFSPLADEPVPPCVQALYLPGGYPELHLQELSAARSFGESVRAHHAAGYPIVAECGGMLALLDSLADASGRRAPMLGLLPGAAELTDGLVNLGMHALRLAEGEIRGHTFHHARLHTRLEPAHQTLPQRDHGQPEAVFRVGRLVASFFHMYFPSNPLAVAGLFRP